MALLFSRSASPHHGFAAYYTYLESIFKVSALLSLFTIADSSIRSDFVKLVLSRAMQHIDVLVHYLRNKLDQEPWRIT